MGEDTNSQDGPHTSEYCKVYGILRFDYVNGFFIYGTKRPLHVRKLQPTFMLLLYLFLDPGNVVPFNNIFEFLKLPYKNKKDFKGSKEKVKHTLKHIRESLSINTQKNPTDDPFVITSYGVGLANLK